MLNTLLTPLLTSHLVFLLPTTITGLLRVDSVNLVFSWKVVDEKQKSVFHNNKDTESAMWARAWLFSPGEA